LATRIVVVSDTHCRKWEEVHPSIKSELASADIAIHCGDFTTMAVVDGMRTVAKQVVVVHGNSDPPELRQAIPYVELLEVEGVRIGVTHPAWGGPEFPLEELLQDFPEGVDVVIFGHFHETINERRNGALFLNPGQGYASFMVPATVIEMTVDSGNVSAEIKVVVPAT
jgi:hypothetical protein|tara:strand:- start:3038 stop:3541 length:504 start_codon:yes stop_codon:yes gene_type:complete